MNLSFAAPWALAALPLAAVPWILHRWALSKAKPLPFPTLELLRAALRSSAASSILIHRLLLAARTLLLLALVLFAARPALRWDAGAASSDEPLSVLVAVDVSASMSARAAGRSRLDWAVEEALRFRPGAGAVQRAGLLAFSDRVESTLAPTADPAAFEAAVRALRPTARPTRAEAALRAAAPLLEKETAARRILLFLTDGAENGWNGAAASLPAEVRVAVLRAPGLPGNAGLLSVDLAAPGRPGRLEAAAWGASAPAAVGWNFAWESRAAAQGRILLGDGAAGAPLPSAPTPPFSRGEASIDPDGFSQDDAFYVLPPAASRLEVLVVNGASALAPTADETYFLSPVLDALAREGGRFKIVLPENLDGENLEGWTVVLLANVGDLPPGAAARLRLFVEKGGGLWVTAGDRFNPALLAPLIPARLTGAFLSDESVAPAPGAAAHPFGARLTSGTGFEWPRLTVDRFAESVADPESTVILSAARSRRPLLILGRHGRGRTAFLATSIDRDWTNLPARPLFPVLCRELFGALAGSDPAGAASLRIDESWEGPWPAASDPVVERPDGTLEAPVKSGTKFRYEKTDLPGFYFLRERRGGPPLLGAAVNLDRRSGESDPRPADLDEILPRLGAAHVSWAQAPVQAYAHVLERTGGRPLRGLLGLLIALLFLLETALLIWMKR